MSYKELIIEQLEILPESVLVQIHEFIQIFRPKVQKNGASNVVQPRPFGDDPLVGLFDGTPDLATRSEDILTEEIKSDSGFTWKVDL